MMEFECRLSHINSLNFKIMSIADADFIYAQGYYCICKNGEIAGFVKGE